MSKSLNVNYYNLVAEGSGFYERVTADTDTFDRTDFDTLTYAVDLHDHSAGKGLPVTNVAASLNVTGLLTVSGGLKVAGGAVTFGSASSANVDFSQVSGNSQITPSTSNFIFRNNANTQNNVVISNAGAMSVTGGLTASGGLIVQGGTPGTTTGQVGFGSTVGQGNGGASTLPVAKGTGFGPSGAGGVGWVAFTINGTTCYFPYWT